MWIEQIFPKLFELLPEASQLLSLEPEQLAGPLLVALDGRDYINPFEVISFHFMRLYFRSHSSVREGYPAKHDDEILFALMESWQWLEREGFVAPRPTHLSGSTSVGVTYYFVTKRGKTIETLEALEVYRKGNLLPKRQLHPTIAQKVWSLFLRGDYDTAVFQAFKEVEVAVRKAGGYADTDLGVSLMRKAFGDKGPLTDLKQLPAEQKARAHLFAGAIGSYKNPGSHRNVDFTAEEAAEVIIVASHLLRIVDSRQKNLVAPHTLEE